MRLDALNDLFHAAPAGAMRLDALNDLFHARAFALGLAFGGVAFLLTSMLGIVRRRRVPDAAGIAFAAAAWLGVRGAWGPELANGKVALALFALAVGGGCVVLIARHSQIGSRFPLVVTAVAIAPGAVYLAAVTPLAGSSTSRAVLAIATIVIGVAMRDFDAMRGPVGAPWLLFAISAVGVYLAVPDTELARVMLGVALPFALLSVPKPMFPLGPAGSPALAGVFAWVVVVGGRGRPGSVVGGLATIGVFVAEPLGRRVFGNLLPPSRRLPTEPFEEDWRMVAAVAGIAQLLIALYASRVVAREDAALSALLIALPMILIAAFCVPMLYPKPQHHSSRHGMDAARPRRPSSVRR
jgi:ABC-type iron transport system FetAB permease component